MVQVTGLWVSNTHQYGTAGVSGCFGLKKICCMETISTVISWIAANLPALSALGAACGFLWTIYQFLLVRGRESAAREFEVFHRLVKELVEPDEKTGVLYIDRQAAVAFELRHFSRYHEFTERLLKSFLHKCEQDQENLGKHAMLLEEMRQTIAFIEKKG
ncbi:hypothetical protein [Variovorax sp. PCZ-1]|uniref:hypothetical protein n=1 Tax=Variovorax sp. PCZ-1 TaxID=2835533 RepID=UPI001BCEF68B|nr:hypothetical protein [Variovorax sp. PCZ-1]MBS7807144.1 hypothetical protein [Variovorax sp. PCZ-1]